MKHIIEHLENLKGNYIALSLWPGIKGTIQSEGNILKVNEGRSGIFEGVSEAFYDELVNNYDSRCKTKLK